MHTPGQWCVERDHSGLYVGTPAQLVCKTYPATSCWVGDAKVSEDANARLISAAPDLLELAEALLGIGDRHEHGVCHGLSPTEYAATIAPMARRAIRKAKGETVEN